jgi:hypothetical protein
LFSDDGRDSLKFYTDPSFFFNLWMQSMIQMPANHNGHRSGKHERHRSPVKSIHQNKVNESFMILYIFFRKDIINKNYIIKNLFMLRIRLRLHNLVLFDKQLKNNNNIEILKISFVIEMILIKSLVVLFDHNNKSVHHRIIVHLFNISIIII